MATLVETAAVPALNNTMGALLIGVLLSSALWGVSVMQAYIYFVTYPEDKLRLRILVTFIFVLDTVHQAMLSHFIYDYLVNNFGNEEFLGVVVWSILVMVILSAIIAVTVQLFMCWRIWILSERNIYWITPVVVVVLASFAITLVYFVKSWSLRTWSKLAELSKISRGVNGLNFGGDITITFAMVYLLSTSKSGIKRTDALMNRLITFCLKTGLLTTICAICSLVSISAWPDTFIYIAFYCILARLYANSFLATLNARDKLRKSNRPPGTSFLSDFTDIEWARSRGTDTSIINSATPTHKTQLSIQREIETHVHSDMELNTFASSRKSLSSSTLPV